MNEYLMVAGFLFGYLVIGYTVMIVVKFVSEETLDEMDMLIGTCFFPVVLAFLAFWGFFWLAKSMAIKLAVLPVTIIAILKGDK